MKPIIGIIAKYVKKDPYYGWSLMTLSNSLRYALTKNGALTMAILPQSDKREFQELDEHDATPISDLEKSEFVRFIDMCDGIVLQGGLYSAYFEEFAASYCYNKDIPLLGICAGYNTMIRALGGTTKKLSDASHEKPDQDFVHPLKVIDKKSRYYSIVKKEQFLVNSIHMYVADKIPPCLKVAAIDNQNNAEVIEDKNKRFFMGIKHHPELLCDIDQKQNQIFAEFIKCCQN